MKFLEREHRLIYFGGGAETQGENIDSNEKEKKVSDTTDSNLDEMTSDEDVENEAEGASSEAQKEIAKDSTVVRQTVEGQIAVLQTQEQTPLVQKQIHALQAISKPPKTQEDMKASRTAAMLAKHKAVLDDPKSTEADKKESREIIAKYSQETSEGTESKLLTKEQAAQKFTEDFCTKFGIEDKQHIAAVNAMVQSPAFQEFSRGVVEKAFAEGVPTAGQLQKIFDQELQNAPQSVKDQVQELTKMIEAGLKKKSPDKKEFSMDDFGEALKEFMKYFKEFLQEIGLIQKDNETGKKDAKGDAKGLEASSKQYEEYNDTKEDMSAADQKKSLEGLKKTVDAQVNDAEKGVDKAKKKVTEIGKRITDTETALGEAKESGNDQEKIAELQKKLDGLKEEKKTAVEEVKKREKTLEGFTELQKKLEGDLKAVPEAGVDNNGFNRELDDRVAALQRAVDEGRTQSDHEALLEWTKRKNAGWTKEQLRGDVAV